MSFGWFIVTTSACRPCSTDSACALDAPCDWRIDTFSPLFCLYAAMKPALMSLYNSRVTSYDTLSSDVSACAVDTPASASVIAVMPAASQRDVPVLPAILSPPIDDENRWPHERAA